MLLEQLDEPQETPFDKRMILDSFRKYYLVFYIFGKVCSESFTCQKIIAN